MQEVDVSVPPQAVEPGLLALMATVPGQDRCSSWHLCSVLEPRKENVSLGEQVGDVGGVPALPALALTFVTCLSWFCAGFPL